MQLSTTELGREITLVVLDGTLDFAAAVEIDLRMNVFARSRRFLIIDLSKVGFLASMGIRVLLTASKMVARRGGKLVLLSPTGLVRGVLTKAGTEALMPIAESLDDATRLCVPD